ncbi:MAG: class I SAM-dependent methyltransferase [Gemmatimonadota bacterium]
MRRRPPGPPPRRPSRPFYARRSLNVETYDARVKAEGTAIDGDVAFYLDQARRAGGPVLEAGAGTGRIAWPLARAGFRTVALERSAAMLRVARGKAHEHPADVRRRLRFVRGDIRRFELGRRFPLVLVTFRTFQMLLTPADQRAALATLRRHLTRGGTLVLDLFDPRLDWCHPAADPADAAARARAAARSSACLRRETLRHPETHNVVQVRVVSNDPDPLTQVLTQVWRFTERGADGRILRREEETLRLRWTHRQEMRWLLELEGFEVEAEHSDFHGSPPAYGLEQVWIARRPR